MAWPVRPGVLNTRVAFRQSATDGSQCTNDVRVRGMVSHSPLPAGTARSQNGGSVRNGTRACVPGASSMIRLCRA